MPLATLRETLISVERLALFYASPAIYFVIEEMLTEHSHVIGKSFNVSQ